MFIPILLGSHRLAPLPNSQAFPRPRVQESKGPSPKVQQVQRANPKVQMSSRLKIQGSQGPRTQRFKGRGVLQALAEQVQDKLSDFFAARLRRAKTKERKERVMN